MSYESLLLSLPLLLSVLLQLLLIFLVLQKEPRLVLEGFSIRRESRKPKKETTSNTIKSENLWENPPPASEELKSTVEEFKDKYNRSDAWDGDFVL